MRADVQRTRRQATEQGLRELFERVASQSEITEDLASVTELLKLPLSCCLAVHRVLREGNWANAEHPRAYIKKATITQARKMHLAIPHADDTLECGDGSLVFLAGGMLDRTTTRERIEKALETEDREHGAARPKRLKRKHYVAGQQVDPFSSSMLRWDDDLYDEREYEAAERGASWPDDCWTMGRRDWEKLGKKIELDPWQVKVLV